MSRMPTYARPQRARSRQAAERRQTWFRTVAIWIQEVLMGKKKDGESPRKPQWIVPRARPDVDLCCANGLAVAKLTKNFRCACPKCLATLGLTLVYDPQEQTPIVSFWHHRVVTARTARCTPEVLWVPGYHPNHSCPIPVEPPQEVPD